MTFKDSYFPWPKYTWVQDGIMRAKCLAQEQNETTLVRLTGKTGPLELESHKLNDVLCQVAQKPFF